MVGERRPLIEDDILWKTTFDGRQPSVEDNLRWKTTFGGRQPSVKDNLWWKMTFGGMAEDDLRWENTFSGRQPSLDPCMLPSLLCGIFFRTNEVTFFWMSNFYQKNKIHLEFDSSVGPTCFCSVDKIKINRPIFISFSLEGNELGENPFSF